MATVGVVYSISMVLLLTASGLALLYFYVTYPAYLAGVAQPDKYLPHFYATQLPAGFGGLHLISPWS